MSARRAVDAQVAEKFCDLCRQTHVAWTIHRKLFEDNPLLSRLGRSRALDFLRRLNPITQEYALHEIVKLHDPAEQFGRENLTIEYVIQFGQWDPQSLRRLNDLRLEMETLLPVKDKAQGIGAARNRVLSHNDLEAVLNDQTLGSFPLGADQQYFEKLREFANIVSERWLSGPFVYDDLAEADVQGFLGLLENELQARRALEQN